MAVKPKLSLYDMVQDLVTKSRAGDTSSEEALKLIYDTLKQEDIGLTPYEKLCSKINRCNACGLASGCSQHVIGDGPLPASIMMIGEGPGAVEDVSGVPFVGPAGKLLDKIIEAAGWNRGDIYITNIVKCRPPDNRTPHVDEVAHCHPFLQEQINMVDPKVIICWGSPAASTVIHPKFQITREHGVWFTAENGCKMIALYHPAYLLRLESADPEKAVEAKKQVWEGIKKIRAYLQTN